MRARTARAQLRSLPAERRRIRPNRPPRYNCRHAYDNTISSGDAAPGTTDRGQTDATLYWRDSDRSVRRKRPQTHPVHPRVVVVPCLTLRIHTCVRLRSPQRPPAAPCAGIPDRRLATGAGKMFSNFLTFTLCGSRGGVLRDGHTTNGTGARECRLPFGRRVAPAQVLRSWRVRRPIRPLAAAVLVISPGAKRLAETQRWRRRHSESNHRRAGCVAVVPGQRRRRPRRSRGADIRSGTRVSPWS